MVRLVSLIFYSLFMLQVQAHASEETFALGRCLSGLKQIETLNKNKILKEDFYQSKSGWVLLAFSAKHNQRMTVEQQQQLIDQSHPDLQACSLFDLEPEVMRVIEFMVKLSSQEEALEHLTGCYSAIFLSDKIVSLAAKERFSAELYNRGKILGAVTAMLDDDISPQIIEQRALQRASAIYKTFESRIIKEYPGYSKGISACVAIGLDMDNFINLLEKK